MKPKYKGTMAAWIYYNNGRKMHGMPLRRKLDKTKRINTRRECDEAIEDFLMYCKYAE